MLATNEAPSSRKAPTIKGVDPRGRFGGSFATKVADVATKTTKVTAKPTDMTAEPSPTMPRGQRRWGECKTQHYHGRRGRIS
jgi:hypothetical protein